MNYYLVYKKSIKFFIIALSSFALVISSEFIYRKYQQYQLDQNQLIKRDVLLDVAMKASSIISANNPSPLFYGTIKRIVVRSPQDSLSGYIYANNNLRIRLKNSVNLFEISKLFNYLEYSQSDADYTLKIL